MTYEKITEGIIADDCCASITAKTILELVSAMHGYLAQGYKPAGGITMIGGMYNVLLYKKPKP
ncbi:MAG: hypothetical protein IPO08_23610 [Xanthomonadales bacterium]|nr:hypothetical protein [Xanthomonadales bacterium]